jgi:hypothetical protein
VRPVRTPLLPGAKIFPVGAADSVISRFIQALATSSSTVM